MSDLISRQDAINTALEFFVEFLGGAFHEDGQKILMKRMNELPSAKPERKKGEWVVKEEDWRKQQSWNECSECGFATSRQYNFCPNCGADMRGKNGKA